MVTCKQCVTCKQWNIVSVLLVELNPVDITAAHFVSDRRLLLLMIDNIKALSVYHTNVSLSCLILVFFWVWFVLFCFGHFDCSVILFYHVFVLDVLVWLSVPVQMTTGKTHLHTDNVLIEALTHMHPLTDTKFGVMTHHGKQNFFMGQQPMPIGMWTLSAHFLSSSCILKHLTCGYQIRHDNPKPTIMRGIFRSRAPDLWSRCWQSHQSSLWCRGHPRQVHGHGE